MPISTARPIHQTFCRFADVVTPGRPELVVQATHPDATIVARGNRLLIEYEKQGIGNRDRLAPSFISAA
jgi:hypothetical protein